MIAGRADEPMQDTKPLEKFTKRTIQAVFGTPEAEAKQNVPGARFAAAGPFPRRRAIGEAWSALDRTSIKIKPDLQ